MLCTKTAIASFFALDTSALALPSPQLPTDENTFPCEYADLAFFSAASLGEGFDIPLNGVPTTTGVFDAPDTVTITIPVDVDCNFYNAEGSSSSLYLLEPPK